MNLEDQPITFADLPGNIQFKIMDTAFTDSDIVPLMAERKMELDRLNNRKQSMLYHQEDFLRTATTANPETHLRLHRGALLFSDEYLKLHNEVEDEIQKVKQETERIRMQFMFYNSAMVRYKRTGHIT